MTAGLNTAVPIIECEAIATPANIFAYVSEWGTMVGEGAKGVGGGGGGGSFRKYGRGGKCGRGAVGKAMAGSMSGAAPTMRN
eukprot:755029-Hanusia_phi.AAC.7